MTKKLENAVLDAELAALAVRLARYTEDPIRIAEALKEQKAASLARDAARK